MAKRKKIFKKSRDKVVSREVPESDVGFYREQGWSEEKSSVNTPDEKQQTKTQNQQEQEVQQEAQEEETITTSEETADVEKEISETKDTIADREKLKEDISSSVQRAGRDATANEEFIQAVSQYARGEPATQDELQEIGTNEFGLRGARPEDVLRRFGVAKDFGRMLDQEQETQEPGTQREPVKETEKSPEQDRVKEEQESKSALEKIQELTSGFAEEAQEVKEEAREEVGLKAKKQKISEAQKKVNELRTEIENAKLINKKKLKELEDEPISNAAIKGEKKELSFEQKIDLMVKQNEYNKAQKDLQIAKGNYEKAKQIVKETANDFKENAQFQLDALKTQDKINQREHERLQQELEYDRKLRMNGYIPIKETNLEEAQKEHGKDRIFTDPVTGKNYIKPEREEKEIKDLSFETIGYDDNGNPIKGWVNKKTGEIRRADENPQEIQNATTEQIANAIKQTESGGDYQVEGESGEFGAYQFMPETWNKISSEFAKEKLDKSIRRLEPTPANQDAVASWKINQLREEGYNPEEIALIWNTSLGGEEKPKRISGTNDQGVQYDSNEYASKVMNNLTGQIKEEDVTKAKDVATERQINSTAQKLPDTSYNELKEMSIDEYNEKAREAEKTEEEEGLDREERIKKNLREDISNGRPLDEIMTDLDNLVVDPFSEEYKDFTIKAIREEIRSLAEDGATLDEAKSHLINAGVPQDAVEKNEDYMKKQGIEGTGFLDTDDTFFSNLFK